MVAVGRAVVVPFVLLVVVTLLLLLGRTTPPSENEQPADNIVQGVKRTKISVALVGDSITFGDGSMASNQPRSKLQRQRGSYPRELQQLLQKANIDADCRMFALGGATAMKAVHLSRKVHGCPRDANSANSCSFWDTRAFDQAALFSSDVLVVMFGTKYVLVV